MHIKKGDSVYILSGKDKGKTGVVARAFPNDDRVLIDGINIKKVHQRAKKKGGKGEMVEKAFPVHASNVKKLKK